MARSLAVLKLSTKVKNVIAFAQNVATVVAGNPSFSNPTPPLAQLQADVAALAQAESATVSRTKGAREARDAKLALVKADLEMLRVYVQSLVDAAPPADGPSLIEGAGLSVHAPNRYDKPALSVRDGAVSGSVILSAKAPAARATYYWQVSTDQKAWTSLPATMQSKTSASGYVPGTTYFFRVQTLTKDGEGDFGQVVSLLMR